MVEPPSVKFSSNYYNGPLWGKFFERKNLKIQNHTILDISLKNVCAKFGWPRARNKKKIIILICPMLTQWKSENLHWVHYDFGKIF